MAVPLFIAYAEPGEPWRIAYQFDGGYEPGSPVRFPVMQPAPMGITHVQAHTVVLYADPEKPGKAKAAVAVFPAEGGRVHLVYCTRLLDEDLAQAIHHCEAAIPLPPPEFV